MVGEQNDSFKKTFRWYILLVTGGRQKKIVEKIRLELRMQKLEEQVNNLLIIDEDNKILKKTILLQASLDQKLVNLLYSIRGISFLNYERKSTKLPSFVADKMIESLVDSTVEAEEKPKEKKEKPSFLPEIGDLVVVTDRPFSSYEARVTKVDREKNWVHLILKQDSNKNDLDNEILLEKWPVSKCQKVF